MRKHRRLIITIALLLTGGTVVTVGVVWGRAYWPSRSGIKLIGGGGIAVQARYASAKQLVRSRKYDEATEEFIWVWKNALDPSMYGVRGSFMAGAMKELARAHPPAHLRFTELRDAAARRVARAPDDDAARADWIVLNQVIGDEEATLAWFDEIKNDLSRLVGLPRSSFSLERLLISRNRWADVGMIVSDPLAKLDRHLEMLKLSTTRDLPENLQAMRDQLAETHQQIFRDQIATLYAALLAADRANDASKLADRAFEAYEHQAKLKFAFVLAALRASQARPIHLEWAREAGEAGEATDGIIGRLMTALDSSPTGD